MSNSKGSILISNANAVGTSLVNKLGGTGYTPNEWASKINTLGIADADIASALANITEGTYTGNDRGAMKICNANDIGTVLNKKFNTSRGFKPTEWSSAIDELTALTTNTVSGSIVSITDGADDVPVVNCNASIPYVQNLNGYSKQWPAGGGKNKIFTGGLILGTPSNTTFANTTPRTWTVGTYVDGITTNNYYQNICTGITVADNDIKFTTSSNAYGIGVPMIGLTVGSTFNISANVTNGRVGFGFYQEDGTYISGGNSQNTTATTASYSSTIPADTYYTVVVFRGITNNEESTFSNIQLEENSTATDYAPYSNVCPITGSTETTVYQFGKNYINDIQQGGIDGTDGREIPSNTRVRTGFMRVLPNTTYTVSVNSSNPNLIIYHIIEYTKDQVWIMSTSSTVQTKTITLSANTCYVRVTARDTTNAYITPTDLANWQLELGNQATTFEPYKSKTPLNIQFNRTVFNGYIDAKRGDGVDLFGTPVEFTGADSESWSYSASGFGKYRVYITLPEDAVKNTAGTATGNYIKQADASVGYPNPWEFWINNNNSIVIGVPETITDASDFKTFLASNHLQVGYNRTTGDSFTTDPNQISTYKNNNTFYNTTGDTSVTYYQTL